MNAIQRQIFGPQEHFESAGEQAFRETRPFTAKLSEALRSSASGFILAMGAVGTYVEPALVNLAVPCAVLYAGWVLKRRVTLPIRVPKTAGIKDHSNPAPGSRKAKMAAGTMFLGWSMTGHELWIPRRTRAST